MRVFLTGATGFIGSHLVPELLRGGHRVLGLSRSEAGTKALIRAGAEVVRGDVTDLARLRVAAEASDAVIHAAFDHGQANAKESSENDRRVIETLGAVTGPERPFIITSGTGLVRSKTTAPAAENDDHATSAEYARAASEEAADALIAKGARVMVLRLPQVHDPHKHGRLTWHIDLAREKGKVAYIGDGANRVAAVHVSDAVRLYRLVLEKGRPGAHYHAVGEEGVTLRDVAEAIGARLKLPVASVSENEAADYFGWLTKLAAADLPASSAVTRRELDWNPSGPDLLSDLRAAA